MNRSRLIVFLSAAGLIILQIIPRPYPPTKQHMQTLHNHKQTAFWNMKVILICTYENMFETLLFQAYLQKSHLA